jgi:hypothetical protein
MRVQANGSYIGWKPRPNRRLKADKISHAGKGLTAKLIIDCCETNAPYATNGAVGVFSQ